MKAEILFHIVFIHIPFVLSLCYIFFSGLSLRTFGDECIQTTNSSVLLTARVNTIPDNVHVQWAVKPFTKRNLQKCKDRSKSSAYLQIQAS